MIIGIDTDVLVSWLVVGTPRHADAQELIRVEVQERASPLALTPQVVHEFLHIVTDPRRFEIPLSMDEALRRIWAIWDSEEVVRVTPSPEVLPRTLELLGEFQLGRKRILDTALAVTLELASIRRLATFNPGDFKIFEFLEIVVPSKAGAPKPGPRRI